MNLRGETGVRIVEGGDPVVGMKHYRKIKVKNMFLGLAPGN